MRRLLLLSLVASLAVAAPADAAPLAKVRTLACQSDREQSGRSATFAGDIRAIPGSVRLQIKFVLQARGVDGEGWAAVAAPGFRTWNTSAPGVARYVHEKQVDDLLAPAAYRVIVRFRWLGPAGEVVLRMRRVSRVCRQPDLRPDLAPVRLARSAGGYVVTVANDGRGDAGPFAVTLEMLGRTYEIGRVEKLAAGRSIRLEAQIPECRPGETLIVRVDPADAVDEADEQANKLVRTCPAA